MQEQISKEFILNGLLKFKRERAVRINEILDSTKVQNKWEFLQTIFLEEWEEQGYIKQSREEEIRKELKEYYSCICTPSIHKFYAELQKELIEILDNKLKEKENA